MKSYTNFALAIPRIGLSLVYLWFGWAQIDNASQWVIHIPDYVKQISPVSPETIIHFNGAFELVFGFALFLGICTRVSSLFLGLHLAHITALVGFTAIGVRDFGVVMGSIGVFLYGPDGLSVDTYLHSPEELRHLSVTNPYPTGSMPTETSNSNLTHPPTNSPVVPVAELTHINTPVTIIDNKQI